MKGDRPPNVQLSYETLWVSLDGEVQGWMGLDGSKCTCKARYGRNRRVYLSTDRCGVCSSETLFWGVDLSG